MLINLDARLDPAVVKEIAGAAGMTVDELRRANVPGGMWPSCRAYEQAATKADELQHLARA